MFIIITISDHRPGHPFNRNVERCDETNGVVEHVVVTDSKRKSQRFGDRAEADRVADGIRAMMDKIAPGMIRVTVL